MSFLLIFGIKGVHFCVHVTPHAMKRPQLAASCTSLSKQNRGTACPAVSARTSCPKPLFVPIAARPFRRMADFRPLCVSTRPCPSLCGGCATPSVCFPLMRTGAPPLPQPPSGSGLYPSLRRRGLYVSRPCETARVPQAREGRVKSLLSPACTPPVSPPCPAARARGALLSPVILRISVKAGRRGHSGRIPPCPPARQAHMDRQRARKGLCPLALYLW